MLVSPNLFITIAPFVNNSIPVFFKNSVLGLTPVATIIKFAAYSFLSVFKPITLFSKVLTSTGLSFKCKDIFSCSLMWFSSKSVISLSKVLFKILDECWKILTFFPSFKAASAISIPIYPAPMIIIFSFSFFIISFFTSKPSLKVFKWYTPSASKFLISLGLVELAPVAITNSS